MGTWLVDGVMDLLGAASPALEASAAIAPPAVGLAPYVLVSALVFGLGVLVVVLRRNAVAVLMGLELLLNAAALNFIAFSRYVTPNRVDGQIVTLFIIVIAAAEAALALAITLNIFSNMNTIEVDETKSLKG